MKASPSCSPLKNTIPQMRIKTTMVRIAVARLELTSFTPILANMAVREAKKAESIA